MYFDLSGLDIFLFIGLITFPLGVWKLIEIIVWVVSHIHIY